MTRRTLFSEHGQSALILRVAIDIPLRRTFDYLAPAGVDERRLRPGLRLLVPFGRDERVGILLSVSRETVARKLKPVIAALDAEPLWSAELFSVIEWGAEYYHHPVGEVLAAALPVRWRQARLIPSLPEAAYAITEAGRQAVLSPARKAPAQTRLLTLLRDAGRPVTRASLDTTAPRWQPTIRLLMDRGLVEKTAVQEHLARKHPVRDTLPALNPAQQAAVDRISASLGRFETFLLHGVTGSGKTEVYLRVIANVLDQGGQALFLVPEISLTAQTIERLERRFGIAVGVLHSGLSDADRAVAYQRARSADAKIIIGTRSAVWTPLARTGVIIVDEEHDLSYKQHEGFRYSARDVAVMRAQRESVPVVLGSATPALESLANARQGRYQRLELPTRAGDSILPEVIVSDIRGMPLQGGMSTGLLQAIDLTVQRGEQVLVFLNRRGYAPTFMCHACGTFSQCRRCDARMTLHAAANVLRCHHCGAERTVPRACENCQSEEMISLGQGTERLAEFLGQRFGQSAVVRIDRDVTRRKGELDAALNAVRSSEARVLVGTQMLAKGHHFPEVTLVAVVDADSQLFSVDLRASERIAQLLVQVAGRAGRGRKDGRVIVQTHHPEHPIFKTLETDGYDTISEVLLEERRTAGLPPYSFHVLLRAEAVDAHMPTRFLETVANLARNAMTNLPASVRRVEVLGPVPAPMARRAGRYRAQLLLQSEKRAELHQVLTALLPEVESLPQTRKVRWSVDVDPVEMF